MKSHSDNNPERDQSESLSGHDFREEVYRKARIGKQGSDYSLYDQTQFEHSEFGHS